MGLTRVLDIAQRSLQTYQSAIDVASHNVANSSNPDYSRQTVVLSTAVPEQQGQFYWGEGVDISQVNRARSEITDQQIRTNSSKYTNNNTQNQILGQVQDLFGEPSDNGLSTITTSFFSSWQDLSVTPNSISLRNNVVQAAQNLSSKIQNIHDGLETIKKNISDQLTSDTTQINSDLSKIYDLNVQIISAQTSGSQPNDLMDSRDKIIDDLSNLANINVTYDNRNSATISLGGVFAVDGGGFNQFKTQESNGQLSVVGTSTSGATLNLTGGDASALTDAYNNKIPGYENSLDSFANRIMTSVNAQHSQGYTLDTPPETSVNFFDSYNGGTLKINSFILNDPSKIAVSKDGTQGNGDVALNIANSINTKDSSGATVQDNYSSLVTQIANDTKNASDSADSYNTILTQLKNQKASYSGVSVDEEMTKIIQYQNSYNAAAKMVTVANDMLQTLINMIS